jgi:molybdenum cofactor guanylyltransferase
VTVHRPDVTAIVLAGGRSTRFGGADKLAADVGGRSLLAGVLRAAQSLTPQVVVVGPERPDVPRWVVRVREEPAYAGPLAAVVAALPHVDGAVAVVLAGDLIDPSPAFDPLLAALEGDESLDGAVVVDREGRRQPLLAAYRVAALRTSLAGLDPVGRAASRLLDGLTVAEVRDLGTWSRDVDAPDDLPR